MSRARSRMDRLIRKTHRFVPKQILETIAEYDRQQLEVTPKMGNLERRVTIFAEVLAKVKSNGGPEATAEFQKLWWDDEEARLTYYVRLKERLPEIAGPGLWFENSIAEGILQRGADAKLGLERLERERKKRKVEEESAGNSVS